MEYQKIINLLNNAPNQINDNARETYNTNSQIKFKTNVKQMLRSSLCDNSDTSLAVTVLFHLLIA